MTKKEEIEGNEVDMDVLDSTIKKGEEETRDGIAKRTEKIVDQHGSAMPDGFAEQMDKALETKSETDDVSEETTDIEDTDVSEETDIDEEIVEEDIEEVVESEDDITDASEEAKEKEKKVETKVETERKTDDVVSKEREEFKVDLDPELVDPQVKTAIDSMVKIINDQQKTIDKEKEGLQAEREKVFETRVDSCFDSYEKDLPRLGGSSKLTEDNGKYRRRVFAYANVARQLDGISIEDAIKDTVQMFKNKEGEKKIEKRLITKLQGQKKKFTNPPTRKKSSPMERKFKSETEKANFIMDEAYKKAGIGT